jgi:copper transport protein
MHRLRTPLRAPTWVAIATSLIVALVVTPSALAHATLDSSTPANDEVLRRAPDQVVLRFDEPVETAFGSVRVYDGAAKRVDDGRTTRPDPKAVAVGLPANLPRGTYTVAWRVVSADSHPVSGAFVFHVGKPGANAAGVVSQVLDEQAGSQAVDVAFWLVRFLNLTFILLGVGGAIALAIVLMAEDARLRRPLWIVLALTASVLALVSLAGIGLEGAKASALGLDAAVRPSLIRDVLDTRFGEAWLLRAVLAGVLALIATLAIWRAGYGRLLAWAAGIVGVVIALTPALSGHARVHGRLAVASDWMHVLAASAWAGGLAFLLLALWRGRGNRWAVASRSVPRFSALAVISITLLLTAGVVNGLYELGSWRGLWETTYGRLLLVKVGLVLPILALGAFNNRVSVPRLRAGLASALERKRFLMSTGVELAIAVVIVGVTAALVAEPPAKAQLAAQGGAVSRDTFVHPFAVNVVVDPARTGPNEVHVYVLNHITGQPAKVAEVRVSASLLAAELGPIRLKAVPAGPGHVVVPKATFPLAGVWTLRLDIRRGEFDQSSTQVTVPIRKDATS